MPQPTEGFERKFTTDHHPLEVKLKTSGTIPILVVTGRLTIGEPSEHLIQAVDEVFKKGSRKMIIELDGVPQIDSSGISALVRVSIKLAKEGGALRLVCGQGRVRDALTVTRLVEAIPSFDSESAALANFA